MLQKARLVTKRLLVQSPVTSQEMWVRKTNKDSSIPSPQRTQHKASQSRFGVRPIFPHPVFFFFVLFSLFFLSTPLPSLGDHHKILLYKRNINLYKYLQREGGGTKAFSVWVQHLSTKTLFHIPLSHIQNILQVHVKFFFFFSLFSFFAMVSNILAS